MPATPSARRSLSRAAALRFPPQRLHGFKALHETRAALALRGSSIRRVWWQQLVVHESPIFRSETAAALDKATLLEGPTGSGKTALAEWLMAFSNPAAASRWIWPGRSASTITLNFFDPEPHAAQLELEPSDVSFTVDGQPHFGPPLAATVIHVDFARRRRDAASDIEQISDLIGVSALHLLAALDGVTRDGPLLRSLRLDPSGSEVRCELAGLDGSIPFQALSGGERDGVVIEIAATLAAASAERGAALLVVDGAGSMDARRLAAYLEFLGQPASTFQTFLAVPTGSPVGPWTGWSRLCLVGRPPDVIIDPDPR